MEKKKLKESTNFVEEVSFNQRNRIIIIKKKITIYNMKIQIIIFSKKERKKYYEDQVILKSNPCKVSTEIKIEIDT